jgi:transposase
MWLKRGVCTRFESGVPSRLPSTDKEVLMTVIIGVDPHKQSHTAVAICGEEREVAKVTVRATRQQTAKLLAWAEPFEERTWAIESAGGLGYLLAQQLVDVGEHVVDVPPTLASRVRVLGTGRSEKNDPNDAFSVAVAALRSQGLRRVEATEHSEIMRLLAKRNHDLGRMRARLICRLHNALADLSPGGMAKELYVSDADRLLESFEPATPIEHLRYELALELVDDVRRLDEQIKESHRRIRTAVRAYFDRKVAEGKTKREAVRSLKRQISNALYRQLVIDAERGPGGH